jgi:hypothetical protein
VPEKSTTIHKLLWMHLTIGFGFGFVSANAKIEWAFFIESKKVIASSSTAEKINSIRVVTNMFWSGKYFCADSKNFHMLYA